ncbi:TetR/AcrR family transcriptional regulator [Pleomorphomonas koreensis]|uniref:TetR/AcrR family transcriptional regulator n=1 Tax=Pleomorphomonas koreensis TaxID=257440 RepID=UPI000410C5B1|nr:TetR/AcrR family transcriptional regulator [Pleomorphomonas koreensis]
MDDRERHILEVTIGLLAEEGLGIATARIARAAGVANGTLFNVFPTKQALLDRVYVTLKGEMTATFGSLDLAGGDFVVALGGAWRSYVLWAVSAPDRHRVMHLLKGGGAVSPAAVAEGEQVFAEVSRFVDAEMAGGRLVAIGFTHFVRLAEAEADVVIALAREGGVTDAALDALIDRGFSVFLNGVTSR